MIFRREACAKDMNSTMIEDDSFCSPIIRQRLHSLSNEELEQLHESETLINYIEHQHSQIIDAERLIFRRSLDTKHVVYIVATADE